MNIGHIKLMLKHITSTNFILYELKFASSLFYCISFIFLLNLLSWSGAETQVYLCAILRFCMLMRIVRGLFLSRDSYFQLLNSM